MRVILLIIISANLLLASDVVADSETGLMWQDNAEAKTTKRNWQEAKSYCQSLDLAGHHDWRLPTIQELQSIVDVSRYKPAIKRNFDYAASANYWSSSQVVFDAEYAWKVSFLYGFMDTWPQSGEYFVRCVRRR